MANKKLVMLEEFEQINKKSDCGCGGNCQCNKSVNEAKKLKFKDIAKAWEFAYGEDFESEYDGIYNEIQGKYKGKITKDELQELWMSMYGEDLTTDYAGFFDNLKENLEEAAKLDEANELDEANPDGTISDDEDERREELEYEVFLQAQSLVQYIKDNAEDIGGPFRSPGIIADCLKQVSDAFKKGKMRLR